LCSEKKNTFRKVFLFPICGEMGWSHVLSSARQEELLSITGRKQIQLPKHCCFRSTSRGTGVPADGQCPEARHTYRVEE